MFVCKYGCQTAKTKSILSPNEFEPSAKTKRLHRKGCKERQGVLQSQLKEMFAESPAKKTDSSEVMNFLQTSSKSLATRTVNAAFSTATYDKRKFQYRNIRKSISFGIGKDETSSQGTEYLQVCQNTEISELQQNLLT